MIRTGKKSEQSRRGFTLVELIVVVVVASLLTGIAIPTFQAVQDRAHDERAKAVLSAILREAKADMSLRGDELGWQSGISAAIDDLSGDTTGEWELLAQDTPSNFYYAVGWELIGEGTKLNLVSRSGRLCYGSSNSVSAGTLTWCGDETPVIQNPVTPTPDPTVTPTPTPTQPTVVSAPSTAPVITDISLVANEEGRISLTWLPVTATSQRPISGYRVLMYSTTTDSFEQVTQTANTTITYPEITTAAFALGVEQSFMVAAYNGGGQGPSSNVASITPVGLPEAAVRIFSSSAAGGMITLDYSVNPYGERPITGGSVTLTNAEDNGDTETASLSMDGSTATAVFSAGELTIGVDHDVTVTLTNAAGSTVINDEPDVLPIDLPNAPAGFSGEMTATEGEIRLSWSVVSSTRANPVTGYRVFVFDDNLDAFVQAYQGAATSTTIEDLTLGVMARFMVATYGSAGEGSRSSEIQATPIGAPSEADTNFDVNADLSAFGTLSFSNLTARPVDTLVVTATATGHTTVTRTVEVSESEESVSYAAGDLDASTTYTFTYTLTNGFGSSNFSAGNLVVPAGQPGKPTITSTTPGNGTVRVAFTAPASTGGQTIIGYTATCTDTNGVETSNDGASSPITLSGLTNEVLYSCMVTARTSTGTGLASDPQSARPTAATYLPFTGNRNGAYSEWGLNGLFYHLGTSQGTSSWSNPTPSIVTTTSSASGTVDRATYTDRALGAVGTSASSSSHNINFTLPSGVSLRPTTYTFMGYGTSMGKNWTYQGSNDNANWTTVGNPVVNNTCSQGYPNWICIIDVETTESYRYHRIVWTGSAIRLYLLEVELYGYYTAAPAPSAPTNVNVSQVAKNAVKVNYTAPNSGTPSSYNVTCTGLNGATTRSVTVSGNATSVYVGNLTEFGDYSCTSRASNFAGGSTSSAATITLGSSNTIALLYSAKFDTNGLMYYLGTNGRTVSFTNPCTSGAVTLTSTAGLTSNKCANTDRYFAGYISSSTNSTHALNVLLPSGATLTPTGYTLTGLDSANAMNDWEFQGSNDLANWTSLGSVTDVSSLAATKAVTLPVDSGTFRYFRFYFTGDPTRVRMYTNEIELYGLYTPAS